MSDKTRLSRRLKLSDAVLLGLGSMIGAGIFAAAGPAANAAGSGLLVGVVLAGLLACLNALTMAQLAAIYPESGGTYVYGRKRLGPFWGYMAGWGFVVGKIASCAAMALTFAYYASPAQSRPLSVGAVVFLTAVNFLGVKKTAFATKVLVGLVLASLTIVVLASLAGGAASVERLSGWTDRGGLSGILQAAGMMFFAFAGYARVATLGEEVLDPKRTIPKAILIALSVTLLVYLIVISTAVLCVDIQMLAISKAPLAAAIESGKYSFLSPIVRIGACLASLGVLISLLAGVSRTVFAMADNQDLPKFLSAVHPIHKVPHRAELIIGLIVVTLVSIADIRSAIGFSSFAVLTYYAIANVAAYTLLGAERRWPRWISVAGFLSCVTIAFSLPKISVIGGIIVFTFGGLIFAIQHQIRKV